MTPRAGAPTGPPGDAELVAMIVASHARLVGRALAPQDDAAWLYHEAPFGLLAHDDRDDPRFSYANLAAQRAFERGWADIVGLPSRLSAGADGQRDRDRLMAAVRERGHASGHRGLRVAASGRRFWIEGVTVWNLLDRRGRHRGQAALFSRTAPVGGNDRADR